MRHTEYDQYDRSRARECLGLALGFLMNYGELWSSNRVPFRIAERREDCGEKNANQAPEIPNSGCHHIESHRHIDISTYRHIDISTYRHIDISTYRHIDMACLKDFFPLPRTTVSYMMRFLFRNVPIQELSHLMWWNVFRFVIFRNHHIWCDFFSVIFLFRNFHIWCDSCSEIVLFRNFHISCIFFQIFSVSGRIAFDMIFFSFPGDFLFSGLDFFLIT